MLAQFDTGTPSFTTDVPINCGCELNSFSSATSNNLMTLISAMSFKSSELDPIPGHLLKECIDTVLPTITKVVNQSLATASFPHQLKEAMIKPLFKKSNLDTDEFKNFRPIYSLAVTRCLLKSRSSTFWSPEAPRMIGMQRTQFCHVHHVYLVVECIAAAPSNQNRACQLVIGRFPVHVCSCCVEILRPHSASNAEVSVVCPIWSERIVASVL